MRLRGNGRGKRRLAVSILATMMIGSALAGCSLRPAGGAAGVQTGDAGVCADGAGQSPGQDAVSRVQVPVKGADGESVCRDILGPPAVGGAAGGQAGAGSAAQPGGAGNGVNAGGSGDEKPGTGNGANAGGSGDEKPGSGNGANAGGSGDAKPGTGNGANAAGNGKPQKPVPPVTLDRPTQPAAAYGGPDGAKLVALTFDDGPDNKYTPKILDILKAKHVHATFFTVGTQVKRYGAVMKRIVQEGSEIGNHSYSHTDLSKLDSTHIMNQIKWTDTLIRKQAGYVPRLVRAPYGASSPQLKRIVADNGRSLVFWTVDTRDWEGVPVAAMRAHVNKNTHPGGIILMHSFGSKHLANTVELLPLVIKDLQAKGYTLVTVSELLDAKVRHAAGKANGAAGKHAGGAKGSAAGGGAGKSGADAQGAAAAGSGSAAGNGEAGKDAGGAASQAGA